MNIYFYKVASNIIQCRVIYSGTPVYFSTEIKLKDGQAWNQTKQKIVRGDNQLDTIDANDTLDEIKKDIKNIYKKESKRLDEELNAINSIPSAENIKDLLSERFHKKYKRKKITEDIVTSLLKNADASKIDKVAEILGLSLTDINKALEISNLDNNENTSEYISLKAEFVKIKKECDNKTFKASERGSTLSNGSFITYSNICKRYIEFLEEHKRGDYNICDMDIYRAGDDVLKRKMMIDNAQDMLEDFLTFMQKATKKKKDISKPRFSLGGIKSNFNLFKGMIGRINNRLYCKIETEGFSIAGQVKTVKKINTHQIKDLFNRKYIFSLIENAKVTDHKKQLFEEVYMAIQISMLTTLRISDVKAISSENLTVSFNEDGTTRYSIETFNQKNKKVLDFPIAKHTYQLINQVRKGDFGDNTMNNNIHDFLQIIPSFNIDIKKRKYDNFNNPIVEIIKAYDHHSMHCLRRTGASLLHANGLPLSDVRILLGHAVGSKATENYIDFIQEVLDENLTEVYKKITQKYITLDAA